MVLWGTITMGVGWSFMRFTTPTDEDIYQRLSPELRRQYDREKDSRRKANDASLQQVFDMRNLDRPAWRTDVPADLKKAGEKQRIPLTLDSKEQ